MHDDLAGQRGPGTRADVVSAFQTSGRCQEGPVAKFVSRSSSSRPAQSNPARALVGPVDVILPVRVIKLWSAPLDDDIRVGLFPEVDARLPNRRPSGCDWRDVLEVE